jgi:hypothetical protein
LFHTKRHACPDAINLRIFLSLRIFSTPMDTLKCSNIIGWKQKFWKFFFCWAKHFLYGAGPWFIPDEHCSFTTEHCHNKVIFREHMLSKNARKSIFATFF